MKRLILLFTSIILLSINHDIAAQVKTKYGDNVGTLNSIMKAYYDVVSVKKGEKVSYERDSLLHYPNVHVGWVEVGKDHETTFRYVNLREYHLRSDPSLEKNGFDEKEISRKVEHFGGIYHVWSTYESRNEPGGKVIERGVNSIELFFDGTRFWILGWFFDGERKGNPIPAKYLTK
ncbi:MAG: hypothetical protein M3N14_10725 [Bacteroidota bacterium]|nr:hypothetical protein [Bacteroidota bacterium]